MPFTTSTMMLVNLLLMGATAVLASPITSSYPQPAFTSVSNSTCPTTVVTFPALITGPTSTVYTHTSTVTSKYDCHGCDGLVVVQLGHNFLEKVSYTTTITEYRPTTYIQAACSPTPGNFQTESITINTTETAGYATITVASKTSNDLLAGTTSTPAAKRSEDFDVEKRQSTPGSPYPAVCWNPITGLFDFTEPGCKITSRSQTDGNVIEVLPSGWVNFTATKIDRDCAASCIASIKLDDPPFKYAKLRLCLELCINLKTCGQITCSATEPAAKRAVDAKFEKRKEIREIEERQNATLVAKHCRSFCVWLHSHDNPAVTHAELAICDTECINVKTCGHETTCPAAKRAVDVELEERQIPEANVTEYCIGLCKFIISDPNLPGGTGLPPAPADLATCVAECLMVSQHGLITGPELEANNEGKIEERQTSNVTEECTNSCNAIANANLPDSAEFPPAPLDVCIAICTTLVQMVGRRTVDLELEQHQKSQCVECPPDGGLCFEVDCPAARRAVDDEIERRETPQCIVCPVNSDDACFEVDCPADAGNGGQDEGQGEKRGIDPTLCYNLCISKHSEPVHQDMHRCRLDCAAPGPVCAVDKCPVITGAADADTEIEVEDRKRQDSLYGHPGADQDDGCYFEGRKLNCSS